MASAVYSIGDRSFLRAPLADPMGGVLNGGDAVASGSDALKTWHHGADLAIEATGITAVASGLSNDIANRGKGLF